MHGKYLKYAFSMQHCYAIGLKSQQSVVETSQIMRRLDDFNSVIGLTSLPSVDDMSKTKRLRYA